MPHSLIFDPSDNLRIAGTGSELPGIAYELPSELPNCHPNCRPSLAHGLNPTARPATRPSIHPQSSCGETTVHATAHASDSDPHVKNGPRFPGAQRIVCSYAAARDCNVYLISSLSGTDREEILVNIQIWLGSDAFPACCGRPPERDKRYAVLQRMSMRDGAAWAAAVCARASACVQPIHYPNTPPG